MPHLLPGFWQIALIKGGSFKISAILEENKTFQSEIKQSFKNTYKWQHSRATIKKIDMEARTSKQEKRKKLNKKTKQK